MTKKHFKAIFFLLTLLGLGSTQKAIAQRAYDFNRPGNECFIQFVCFKHDNDYQSGKYPYIFVLGRPNETAREMYEKDSLKNLPQFFSYQFVYVPNRGGSALNKLFCLEAMAGNITNNFQYGHANMFLAVFDPQISESDIAANNMHRVFKSIHLYASPKDSNAVVSAKNITEDFRENAMGYETEYETEEDKYGTFYVDESLTSEKDALLAVPQKTYFGAPSALNYTLTGVVRDKSTGEALSFATVHVRGTTIGTATNADGYFTLLKVPSDTSVLVVQYIGYGKTEVFLTPQDSKKGFIISVQPASNNLKTVNIVTSREDVVLIKRSDVSVLKLTPKKLEQLPNIGERDIMRSFQLMPGVSASNEFRLWTKF